MITYNIRLDINGNGTQAMVYARQGDAVGRRFAIRLFDGTTPVSFNTGDTFVIYGGKPDGTQVYADCTLSGTTIYYNIPANFTSAKGNVECQLKVYGSNGSLLYSPRFNLFVEETVTPDTLLESTNEYSALNTAMLQANSYKNAWSNPVINVTNGNTPSGSVTIGNSSVTFDIVVQKGQDGRPAEIGDEAGILVETGEDGVLVAGRKLWIGTDEPEDVSGLRPGDIYIKLDE